MAIKAFALALLHTVYFSKTHLVTSFTSYPCPITFHRRHTRKAKLNAKLGTASPSDLPTSFEWLANERDGDTNGPLSCIEWFDPTTMAELIDEDMIKVPLYPIDTCYLPTNTTQYINNVHKKNIKMMLDITAGNNTHLDEYGNFVVTLRASDTDRLAKIGTLMKVIELDEQRSYIGEIIRIVATCVPQGLVQIQHIHNPTVYNYFDTGISHRNSAFVTRRSS